MKTTLALFTLLLFSSNAYSETCLHSIKEGSEKITWTGFKYTEKTAVSGTFDKVKFKQVKDSPSMSELLESVEFEIDTKSVNSGNPARDTTLKGSIFGFLKVPNTISGKIVSATQLDMAVEMTLNKKTPMQMSLDAKDGKITSTGTLNLLEHGLKKSYDAVHVACKGLHVGKDGVSKTWSTVEIKVEADYEVKCSKGLMDSIKSWFS
ncbi:MAG: YceI family protein [Bdellovibrionales bacterium]